MSEASWLTGLGRTLTGLTVLFTANLPSNACVMVYHKLAYFITIQGSISFWDKEKVTYRPLSPALTTTSVLAWKRQQPFSVAVSAFIIMRKRCCNDGKKELVRYMLTEHLN